MSSGRASRQRSRGAALQVLFAVDVRLAHAKESSAAPGAQAQREALTAEAFADAVDHTEIPRSAVEFARALVDGVSCELEQIDAKIRQFARNWRLERMATVDRNVLRLAVYEMTIGGIPPAVAIDQAVELARRFGGEHSPSFVNGVLDAVARAESGSTSATGGAGKEGVLPAVEGS